jgi:hypothetical protein
MRYIPRRLLLIWGLFCATAGVIFVGYVLASLAVGRGEFVLPLDDVYIHFQYARQLANGQPFVYNPGQPPTSGATSFLYPFILAFGYLIGFQGPNLALWAMVVGALALIGSMWLIYRLVKIFDSPDWLAIVTALIFALTGAVSWHFMSGMETGLMILLSLATLYTVIARRFSAFIISASLLALMRPEGGILSVVAVGAMVVQSGVVGAQRAQRKPIWSAAPLRKRQILFLLIPILTLGVQPLVNWLVTGSAVASGNAAKSIFGTIPFDWGIVIQRILENFAHMWVEFVTGYSPREGWYLPLLIGALAIVGLALLLIRRERRLIGLLILVWLIAGTGAVSTLDTAFWHFKRYQMPLIALLFPLAAWEIQMLHDEVERHRKIADGKVSFLASWRFRFYFLLVLFTVLWTSAAFLQHFALNVDYIYRQPLQMARWLQAHTPEDAVVAVHDVGMMRYMGGRTTLDMVGLTTPGAAEYWRNGPGSVAEFLIRSRPDYIASYGHGHGYGLGMIADTDIYGEPLASFPVTLDPNYNVALAADFQGIYKPDWSRAIFNSDSDVLEFEGQHAEIDVLHLADLESEKRYQYHWNNRTAVPGFATGIYQLAFPFCENNDCKFYSATRHINGTESFVVDARSGENALLWTLLHPLFRGQYDVYVNNQFVDRNWIPAMPGYWLTVTTRIPSHLINSDELKIRIESDIPDQGYYAPAVHTVIWGALEPDVFTGQAIATFQDGAIQLVDAFLGDISNSENLSVDFTWYTDGSAQGDYKVFVHILDEKGEIVAQSDGYPGHGTLPPGNWLPGNLEDQMTVNLDGVPPGLYRVAIGFYNPYTFERLIPQSDTLEISADSRLFIGNIEVK